MNYKRPRTHYSLNWQSRSYYFNLKWFRTSRSESEFWFPHIFSPYTLLNIHHPDQNRRKSLLDWNLCTNQGNSARIRNHSKSKTRACTAPCLKLWGNESIYIVTVPAPTPTWITFNEMCFKLFFTRATNTVCWLVLPEKRTSKFQSKPWCHRLNHIATKKSTPQESNHRAKLRLVTLLREWTRAGITVQIQSILLAWELTTICAVSSVQCACSVRRLSLSWQEVLSSEVVLARAFREYSLKWRLYFNVSLMVCPCVPQKVE